MQSLQCGAPMEMALAPTFHLLAAPAVPNGSRLASSNSNVQATDLYNI